MSSRITLALSLAAGLCLASEASHGQAPPTSQCVTTAVAGGTGDAITIARLPCVPTTTLLTLVISYANTTTSPTLAPVGSPVLPIVNADGSAVQIGALRPGVHALLQSNGLEWFWLNSSAIATTGSASGLAACTNILGYGGVGNNTTDNVPAWNAAIASGANCIAFPQGQYYFSGSVSVTLSGANQGFAVRGAGQEVSVLRFPADGITVTKAGLDSSIHVADLTITTDSVNGGTGLSFLQLGTRVPSNATFAQISQPNDVSRVTFRGSDGAGAKCFATGFYTDYVSNINFPADSFIGCVTLAGIGIKFAGGGDINKTGVQYNINGSYFGLLQYGVWYGEYIQGIQISLANFTGLTYGIYVPAGEHNDSQLTLMDSQCGFTNYCIYDGSGLPQVTVIGNLIYSSEQNFYGLWLESANQLVVVGNAFGGVSGEENSWNLTGIYINSEESNNGAGTPVGWGGVISNNSFTFLTKAIVLPPNSSTPLPEPRYVSVSFNNFTGGSTQPSVTNTSINNTIFNLPFVSAAVTGAVNNGNGQVRLTVADTSKFVTGVVALIAGVGGTGATSSAVIDKLAVIDGTHLDTFTAAFSGTYTSGGTITTMP